ncbi:SDR family NAD(P)-dependent oxidoreductase [Bernardetia sp. Wsw4-3y2]|uniref:SDR family NAD(P)-dependent oxidoreductase n=1 Tax=Bernardetia sp. Wsw4-3y2 TaxID=3127471 RepID=UPI0030D539B4
MENQTKIAVVTGGSRGLGKDMAINIAKKGIDVILTYNSNKEEAQKVVKQIEEIGQKAVALQLNVAEIKSFDSFTENVKTALKNDFNSSKIDFLINNAGIGIHTAFTQTTEEQFDILSTIHLKGVVFLTQKMLLIMNDGGGVVNISSGLTRIALAGYSIYATMKGAIETLTKYQAKELGERKIRVNVVALEQ